MTYEQKKQFYLDNCATLTYDEMKKALGLSSMNLTKMMKENHFPKKPKVYKPVEISTTFFSWKWASIHDPIMCLN
jgi:predicted DNA-binding transcriptional regulator AlpA